MFAQARKGVGDSLAGGRTGSRRHDGQGAALRDARPDLTRGGGTTVGCQTGGGWHPAAGPLTSAVSNARDAVGGNGATSVQALDPEASALDPQEALVAAVRRHGGVRHHAAGGPSV